MIPRACHGPQGPCGNSGWCRVGCICYLFLYYGMGSVFLLKMSVSIQHCSSGKRVRRELHCTFSKTEWILINMLSSVGSWWLWSLNRICIPDHVRWPSNTAFIKTSSARSHIWDFVICLMCFRERWRGWFVGWGMSSLERGKSWLDEIQMPSVAEW